MLEAFKMLFQIGFTMDILILISFREYLIEFANLYPILKTVDMLAGDREMIPMEFNQNTRIWVRF